MKELIKFLIMFVVVIYCLPVFILSAIYSLWAWNENHVAKTWLSIVELASNTLGEEGWL